MSGIRVSRIVYTLCIRSTYTLYVYDYSVQSSPAPLVQLSLPPLRFKPLLSLVYSPLIYALPFDSPSQNFFRKIFSKFFFAKIFPKIFFQKFFSSYIFFLYAFRLFSPYLLPLICGRLNKFIYSPYILFLYIILIRLFVYLRSACAERRRLRRRYL